MIGVSVSEGATRHSAGRLRVEAPSFALTLLRNAVQQSRWGWGEPRSRAATHGELKRPDTDALRAPAAENRRLHRALARATRPIVRRISALAGVATRTR